MNKGLGIFLLTALGLGAAFASNVSSFKNFVKDYKFQELGNKTLHQTFYYTLEQQQLVVNGDLTLSKPSPNEKQPLGFTYIYATDITLVNGIAKFTATQENGRIILQNSSTFNTTDNFYNYAIIKSSNTNVGVINPSGNFVFHSGSGSYEIISSYGIFYSVYYFGQVIDRNIANFSPIEIDYIGAFNVDNLKASKQFSPLYDTTFDLMDNTQIKAQMDLWSTKDLKGIPLDIKLSQDQMDYYYDIYKHPEKLINEPSKDLYFFGDYARYLGSYGLNIITNTISGVTNGINGVVGFFKDLFSGQLFKNLNAGIFDGIKWNNITIPILI